MNNKQKTIFLYITMLVLFVLGVAQYKSENNTISNNPTNNNNNPVGIIEGKTKRKLIDLYKENKSYNRDYLGEIYFDSGLISLPFVKGINNEIYLTTNFKTRKPVTGGTVFIDYKSTIGETKNVVMYGHNFNTRYDKYSEKMFSPLRVLRKQENYEANRYLNLFMGDVLYRYEVACVYRVKVLEVDDKQFLVYGEPNYTVRDFTEKSFENFKRKILERQYYPTGVDFTIDDQFLTLQTCIDSINDKYIIFCKLIEISNDVNDLTVVDRVPIKGPELGTHVIKKLPMLQIK